MEVFKILQEEKKLVFITLNNKSLIFKLRIVHKIKFYNTCILMLQSIKFK